MGVRGYGWAKIPTGTAIAAAGAATLGTQAGKVTSEALTTAGGGDYALTLTNSSIAAADMILWSVGNGTNTGGEPLAENVTPGVGSAVFEIHNNSALTAFNGTVVISYVVVKA